MLVIAPLGANTLAKIVGGFADNLLLSVIRAWDTTGIIDPLRLPPSSSQASGTAGAVDGGNGEVVNGGQGSSLPKRKRIIVAPAMNTAMWRQPVTKRKIRVLEEEWGVEGEKSGGEGWFELLYPMEKELACGDVGDGAMKDWREIVKVIEERLDLGSPETT